MHDLITEFIGTFVFIGVIIATGGQAFAVGLALAAVILFGSKISGGHFNPAVSTVMYVSGKLKLDKYIGYIIAQVIGGLLAFWFLKNASIMHKN